MNSKDIITLIVLFTCIIPLIVSLVILLFRSVNESLKIDRDRQNCIKDIYELLKKHDDDEITFDKVDK